MLHEPLADIIRSMAIAPGKAAMELALAMREVYGGEWTIMMWRDGSRCFTVETRRDI